VRTGAVAGSSTASYFDKLYTSNDLRQIQGSVQQTMGEGAVNSAGLIVGQTQAFHGAIGQQQSAFQAGPHSLALGAASGLWSTAAQSKMGYASDSQDNGLLQTLAQVAVMNADDQRLARSDALGLRGQVQWIHQGARGGISGYNAEMGLAALGYDTALSNDVRIGLAAGFSNGESRGAGTTTRVKSWFAGPYATVQAGPITLDGDLTYTYSQGKLSGSYSFPVADSTSGHFTANTFSGNLKASHTFNFSDDTVRLIPSVGVEATYTARDAFNESGSSITRRYAAGDMTSVGIPVGAALQRDFEFGKVTVTPEVSAYYVREVADTAPTARVTLLDSTSTFSTKGADAGTELWRAGFGLNADLGNGFAASARYTGEFGNCYSNNGAELQLKYAF